MGEYGYDPLFRSERAKWRAAYKLYASSVLVGIILIWFYRATHVPADGRWCWLGLLGADIWFGFYWIITQSVRWNPVYYHTHKEKLMKRFGTTLPAVDIFVCTADPNVEPPALVISTVLSVMAYDYPPEKLSVYLSDDAGSDLTFYALWEASHFAAHWLPYCKKFNVEPRSPAAYFSKISDPCDTDNLIEWSNMKIRVSSAISNGPVILNVDCDMYSNNSESIKDAICFFLDEKGHDISYVQYPQHYANMTKNDLYANSLTVINEVEHPGMNNWAGPLYIGTGCFHRRESLCGRKYSNGYIEDWNKGIERRSGESGSTLEERAKILATCAYEHDTLWGKEMGLMYGCPVEDVITGLSIQCRGWRSIYFNSPKRAFLGISPTTLEQTLVQHKRWSEGNIQIVLSRYCSFVQGHGKLKLGHKMGYCIYGLWALNSIPTLYYLIIPPICLLNGVALFPTISSPWFIPFAYVIIVKNIYSLIESLKCGETFIGWWNSQRIWVIRRLTSYLYGTIDTVLQLFGLSNLAFEITAKVTDNDVLKRYEQEVMEFGSSSSMFIIIGTVTVLNLICWAGGMKRIMMGEGVKYSEPFLVQLLLCSVMVCINFPIFEGLFWRKDRGGMPHSVTIISLGIAMLACLLPIA